MLLQLFVREGRIVRTRTVDNNLNPEWNQTFSLLVDDVGSQSLCESALSLPALPQPYSDLQCTHAVPHTGCNAFSADPRGSAGSCLEHLWAKTMIWSAKCMCWAQSTHGVLSCMQPATFLRFLCAAFVVKDDDLGFEDDVLGAYEIELDDAEFIMKPRETIPLTLQLLEADDQGFINDVKAFSRMVGHCGFQQRLACSLLHLPLYSLYKFC